MPLVYLCAFDRRFARRVVKALRQPVLMCDWGGLRWTKVARLALLCRLVLVRSCLEFRWVYVWKEIRQIDEKQWIPCFWGANNRPPFSLSAFASCAFAAFYRLAGANHRLARANNNWSNLKLFKSKHIFLFLYTKRCLLQLFLQNKPSCEISHQL